MSLARFIILITVVLAIACTTPADIQQRIDSYVQIFPFDLDRENARCYLDDNNGVVALHCGFSETTRQYNKTHDVYSLRYITQEGILHQESFIIPHLEHIRLPEGFTIAEKGTNTYKVIKT